MAGQRARTPYQDAGPRTEDRPLPAQRTRTAGRPGAGAEAPDPGVAGPTRLQRAGTARRRQQARRRGGLVAALSAVGLPVLGGVVDEFGGPGVGVLFAAGSVLGTAAAAVLCSRPGRWWVVTGAPVVVLLVASGVEYAAHPDKYQGGNLGTGALRWVVGAFPVMATAVGVALAVVVGRTVADRRRAVPAGRRSGSADAPGGRSRRG
ncbi:DUF6542 domain-containing protein [Streptomyces sp. NRRL S-350]|uniref:DUF6542 domain-containing protein n=1 Tax=Streptomyces sp. NRRL S-350 TaxID=1463902 RepID=UPI00068965A6|nr:DUF6542 domain-containing protein [Streptomyces sp. NRRL S-350]